MEGKFAFPVASTVCLEDEVVACCCSQEIKAFFCPWLGSPLSLHWYRKLSVSLLAAVGQSLMFVTKYFEIYCRGGQMLLLACDRMIHTVRSRKLLPWLDAMVRPDWSTCPDT